MKYFCAPCFADLFVAVLFRIMIYSSEASLPQHVIQIFNITLVHSNLDDILTFNNDDFNRKTFVPAYGVYIINLCDLLDYEKNIFHFKVRIICIETFIFTNKILIIDTWNSNVYFTSCAFRDIKSHLYR